jgi:hypothetical protein
MVWQGEGRGDDGWGDARDLCNGVWAGQANWRLPTPIELASLIDDRVGDGARIDHEAFPNWEDRFFWSATTSHDDPGDRYWAVNFDNGDIRRRFDHEHAHIRCVTEADPGPRR